MGDGGRVAQNKYDSVVTLPGPIETAIRSMGGEREGAATLRTINRVIKRFP